jgi:hypothetical protein
MIQTFSLTCFMSSEIERLETNLANNEFILVYSQQIKSHIVFNMSTTTQQQPGTADKDKRTGMQRRIVNCNSALLQHMQQSCFTSIIKTQKKDLGTLVIQTCVEVE